MMRSLKKPLNRYFDHTLLKPEAGEEEIRQLCREACQGEFYAVCVNSCQVETAVSELKAKGYYPEQVKVAAVVGFPLGACGSEVKAFEAAWACEKGASEIDMVINIGAMKDKRYEDVMADIKGVVRAAAREGGIVKVILETCLLTDEEIVKACGLAEEAGAAFVKTSTGFSAAGATVPHVALMKETVGDRLQVKASGGIRSLPAVLALIEAGADRIGASASLQIMKEADEN